MRTDNTPGKAEYLSRRFTSYERDNSNVDEAMNPSYHGWWSRFGQPDPYDGSYDLGDPQSFKSYLEEKKMKDDPAITSIGEVHHRISAKYDHDPRKVIDYYIELQKQYQDRLIESSESKEEKDNHPVEVG